MTDSDKKIVTPKPSRSSKLAWFLLGITLLSGAGAAGILRCPWLSPLLGPAAEQKPGAEITALEKRVGQLEKQVDDMTQIAAVIPTPSASDNGGPQNLGDKTKDPQNQIAALENKNTDAKVQTARMIASAFAFLDLRDAARIGRAFTPQLAALRAASKDDAVIVEQTDRLAPLAASTTPVCAMLKNDLRAQEAGLIPEETNDKWQKIKNIFRPLISVHPARDARFTTLEQALDDSDAAEVEKTFADLPPDAQKKLTAWKKHLDDRATIDAALAALAAHFTAVPGNTP